MTRNDGTALLHPSATGFSRRSNPPWVRHSCLTWSGAPALQPQPRNHTNNQQPTTNNQQPTTNNQQPTTNNQQPTTNNQQPTGYAHSLDSLELLKELVALPAPPGQEAPVRATLQRVLKGLNIPTEIDAKGNLLALIGDPKETPEIVVTAHMDEIGLMVESILPDGFLKVVPLGGLHPWKWGETPVTILAREAQLPGILSFGSIHTESDQSSAKKARDKGLAWAHAAVFTGLKEKELKKAGIRPGTRIAMAPSQRSVTEIGPYVGSYFLDDRADLVAWLLTLEKLKATKQSILFAATVSEEVGGEGALFLLQRVRPAICVALELGPIVPESQFPLDATPTVWVRDSYACIDPRDVAILEACEVKLKTDLHWQALSRGGSDASCAASHGHCARPVTLGIPMENTHGYEIMHRDGPQRLAELTLAYLTAVVKE